jgi:DNA modification methylase
MNRRQQSDTVLDTFGGSGPTLIARSTYELPGCLQIDPKYCDVIIRRWQDWSGEKAYNEEGRSFDEVSNERLAPSLLRE